MSSPKLLLPGYWLRSGSGLERASLVKFMQRTYQELYPDQDFSHLAQTVERYLTHDSPVWWVELEEPSPATSTTLLSRAALSPVACLWLGNSVDQVTGDRHACIFLLYVLPEHRRRGIATALIQHAIAWSQARGDRQLGLQVFQANQPALNLYQKLGFQTQALWMVKPLESPPTAG
ncbi:GNAT family N-acetyltransferase [Trichocoleus sp. FACHB-591]|uniref:GNAT family N-acetyltransferase n=1 Tax=Trichocoleus sp. FACHB-591 TaxID=2692872 RepID=UPI00351C3A2C